MQILLDYIYALNWFAVIIAAIAGFAVNALWYSDKLFGNEWRKSIKLKKKDMKKPGMDLVMIISFATMVITSAAVGVLTDVLHISGGFNGVLLGIVLAFGFVVTTRGMHDLFEQRPFAHFAITAVGDLLTLAAIGAILAVW